MNSRIIMFLGAFFGLVLLSFTGCGSTAQVHTTDLDVLRSQLDEKEQEISSLKSSMNVTSDSLQQVTAKLAAKEAELTEASSTSTDTPDIPVSMDGAHLLPPKAEAGECYARVYVGPTYRTVTDTVVKAVASERVEVIPAQYDWAEERVLVKEASTRLEEVPATYEWVEERVLVREAHTAWKRGRGLVERVDDATGEIMCLVEVPAQYKTVRTKVEASPATVREITIPAEYETIKVRKIVSPAKEKRIAIPAQYQYVTRTEQVTDGRMEWRRVLCETNLTRVKGTQLQRALLDAGHDPGPIDGIFGPLTHRALKDYQEKHDLATGGLTYETVTHLGVQLSSVE